MRKDGVRRGIFAFFTTSAGRQFTFYLSGFTTAGLFVGNWIPHTLGLGYFKDFVQCYQNGSARPVTQNVLERLEDAFEKLKVSDFERKLIKPFSVFGFDLFQAGSTKYRSGAALGIPVNYSYANVNEINRADVRFRNQQIEWNSEGGKLLQEAIVLTEDEQVFGLCKSILQLQTHRVLMNSLFPSVAFMSMYTLGRYLNVNLKLFTKPMSLRIVMYGILGCFGFGSWSFLKDFNQVSYDADIDKRLATMGPDFVQAGVSFYDKILKKNMALRTLIGDDTYTSKGNENYLLRQKSLPLTLRKSFFEEKWRELQDKNISSQSKQENAQLGM